MDDRGVDPSASFGGESPSRSYSPSALHERGRGFLGDVHDVVVEVEFVVQGDR